MSEPRVLLLPLEEAARRAEALGLDAQFAGLSVFRILLQNEPVAKELANSVTTLLFTGNSLDGRLRELLIMRIAWQTGSDYEWTQHWRIARRMDIPAEDLLAVRDWRASEILGDADRAVLQATDNTLEHGSIQPETWSACCEHLATEAERVELVVAIGNWIMFSQLLQSLAVPLEEGVDAWPPDGKAPR